MLGYNPFPILETLGFFKGCDYKYLMWSCNPKNRQFTYYIKKFCSTEVVLLPSSVRKDQVALFTSAFVKKGVPWLNGNSTNACCPYYIHLEFWMCDRMLFQYHKTCKTLQVLIHRQAHRKKHDTKNGSVRPLVCFVAGLFCCHVAMVSQGSHLQP